MGERLGNRQIALHERIGGIGQLEKFQAALGPPDGTIGLVLVVRRLRSAQAPLRRQGRAAFRMVVRELLDVLIVAQRPPSVEHACNFAVQALQTRSGELGQQHLAQDGVAELEPPPRLHDDSRGSCQLQFLEYVVPDERFDDIWIEAAAQHCGCAQHHADILAETGEPATDHLAQAFRKRQPAFADPSVVGSADRAGFSEVTQHLADEQRVACGARLHCAREP